MAAAQRNRSQPAVTMAAAMAALGGIGLWYIVSAGGLAGTALSVLAATLPVVVVAAIVLLFDRYEPEPRGMLALTFAFGATGAVAIALVFNTLGHNVLTAALGMNTGSFVTTALVAPFVEEIAKGAAVLVVMLRLKDGFNGVVDGVVYAVMVGLGFAFAENISYYTAALLEGQGLFASTVIMRGGFSAFTHPLFTTMSGVGLALSIDRTRNRLLPPLVGLAAAMVLHGIWNASTYLGGGFILVYLAVFIPLLLIAVVVTWMAAAREGTVLSAYLEPDVSAGLLTEDEVAELGSLSRRRRMLKRAQQHGGAAAREARKEFHRAAAQLAFLRHRARPSAPDPEIELAWARQIARYKRAVDPTWVAPDGIGEP